MKKKVDRTHMRDWGIKRTGKGRYIIIDTINGKILDDIRGHGCKSYFAAYYYGYNKYHNKGKCKGEINADDFNTLI